MADVLTYPHYEHRFPREMWVLPRILEHQAIHRADRPFLSWTDANPPLSFAEVNARVNSLAHGFAAEGLKKGDKVVIFMPNSLEFVLAWFALSKIGAIEVPIGDMQRGAFLEHQINLSQARRIITTPALIERIAEVEANVPLLETCYLLDGAEEPTPFRRIKSAPFASLETGNTVNPDVEITSQDVASILYTSGTTGMSKGVIMPHSQFYFFAEEDVQLVGLTEDDVYMTGFPFFHGNAQFLTIYPCLIAGAHCVLYARFSASDYFGRARRSGATVANLLGATMAFICASPPSEDDRAHKLGRIYAAPLAFDLAKQFTDRFGPIEFLDGFGQTEISNVFMTPRGAKRPEGASGVLVDQFFEVRIADPETDEPVAEGEVGELLVRHKAPGIMCSGYLGMPEKTVETWRNLWFHTGDALRRDADGWYYFVDRVKDALRRRGENISSFEVESVIRAHPAVAECAVVGVKADEKGGEDEVKACVMVAESSSLDFSDLIAWCEERMPPFMVPRYIELFDRLPQTPSEKIKKKELREMGVTPSTWDREQAGVYLKNERRPVRARE
jgi:crotonobetaine/carnitine-CoA ligase